MRLGPRSSLETIALAVGDALRRKRVRAVLTGGACASIYTSGRYTSDDADFVLLGEVERGPLDEVMASLGFGRRLDRYVHPGTDFFVEFLPGPVAMGGDHSIRPTTRSKGGSRILILSATDSCRDRLAAFYHWNDRQSLSVAVEIALRNRINGRTLREWSRKEGFPEKFEEFRRALGKARSGASKRRSPRRPGR